MIRMDPHYRRQAFVGGLERAGYQVGEFNRPSSPQDLLVIWNRYGAFEQRANAWEAHGGTVLVAENGYLGADADGRQFYALSAGGHNGSGWIPAGPLDRFAALGIEPQPWRKGSTIIVRGQRGIGTALMASPSNWHGRIGNELRSRQPLPVKVLEHPGRHAPAVPIERELETAAGCAIWCSSVGVKALVMGVPVWFDAPHWICGIGGRRLQDDPNLEDPKRDDGARLCALNVMASAQWSVAELESGEPFARFRDELKVAA